MFSGGELRSFCSRHKLLKSDLYYFVLMFFSFLSIQILCLKLDQSSCEYVCVCVYVYMCVYVHMYMYISILSVVCIINYTLPFQFGDARA